MWKHIFGYGNTRFCLCQDTGTMNRPLRLTECSHPISWVYVECFAEYSPRIRNSFRMHSRNVRNVFVICVLHIRHTKRWFLRRKSMVFSVQKGGFCIAKRGFLFFECWVVAICLECYHNSFAAKWQSVSNILAIRLQHFGNPSAAIGVRFIVPAIYIRHPFCVCLVDIKSVLWLLCPLAKMVRLRWLCSVCLLVCRLFGYC